MKTAASWESSFVTNVSTTMNSIGPLACVRAIFVNYPIAKLVDSLETKKNASNAKMASD